MDERYDDIISLNFWKRAHSIKTGDPEFSVPNVLPQSAKKNSQGPRRWYKGRIFQALTNISSESGNGPPKTLQGMPPIAALVNLEDEKRTSVYSSIDNLNCDSIFQKYAT